jgi:hypothetical protein
MEPATWTTGPDAAAVLDTMKQTLESQGYTVTVDESGWAGRAEVGSKVGRALAGGFVRRMVVDFAVSQGAPGTTQLVIAPATSGWSGGAIGASQAKKEMTAVASGVHQALAARGLIAG